MLKSLQIDIKENNQFLDELILDFVYDGPRKLIMGEERSDQVLVLIRKASMKEEAPKISPYGMGGIGNFLALCILILVVVIESDNRGWRDHKRILMDDENASL